MITPLHYLLHIATSEIPLIVRINSHLEGFLLNLGVLHNKNNFF